MIELFSQDATMPGVATTTYVSWEDVASALGIDEQWMLLSHEDIPEWVQETAFKEAEQFISPQTPADKRMELESRIIDSIVSHWSPEKVIPQNVDLAQLFARINAWASQDPVDKNIFGKPPVPGAALEWIDEDGGLQLTVYPAFEIPYVESYYKLYRYLPELNLDELSGYEIVETCYFVEAALGNKIEVDLTDWDELRPRVYDLV